MSDSNQAVDWTNDEAVVKACYFAALVFADAVGRIWYMNKSTAAQIFLGNNWTEARAGEHVQAYERQHNPAYAVGLPTTDAALQPASPAVASEPSAPATVQADAPVVDRPDLFEEWWASPAIGGNEPLVDAEDLAITGAMKVAGHAAWNAQAQRISTLEAEAAASAAREGDYLHKIAELKRIIRWTLGESPEGLPDFPAKPTGSGTFYWRTTLRELLSRTMSRPTEAELDLVNIKDSKRKGEQG